MSHRSVSQYQGFLHCGESYRLQKVAKAPQTPAAWFIQGTAFHEAIEKFEKSNRAADPDTVRQWYEEAWDREAAKAMIAEPDQSKWLTGGVTKPATDFEKRFIKGGDQVEAYYWYALESEWKIWEPVEGVKAIELPFELDLGGVKVIGYIDQVVEYPDGHLRVRDLKTGTKLPATAFQLAMYDHGIDAMFGVKPGFGDYYMAKNNKETDPWNLQDYTLDKVTRWMVQMDKAVKLGHFLPNPGDACRTCTVRPYCDFNGINRSQFPVEGVQE